MHHAYCVCILNFANVQSGHVWTLKIQPNASCHCAHADVQPPESNEKSYKRSVNLWLWKILRKSLCTWKNVLLLHSHSPHPSTSLHISPQSPWPTSPSHLAKHLDIHTEWHPCGKWFETAGLCRPRCLGSRVSGCATCPQLWFVVLEIDVKDIYRLMALDNYVQLHSKWLVLDWFFGAVLRGSASTFLCVFFCPGLAARLITPCTGLWWLGSVACRINMLMQRVIQVFLYILQQSVEDHNPFRESICTYTWTCRSVYL